MSTGGDAADQMVRDGIEIVESSVKLSALGAKNLAAIAIALAKDNPKLRGKTNLDRLLKDGKELQVFPLKISDLREFNQQAKQYGILFTAIKEKNGEGELVDILVRAEDVSKLNRVFERMSFNASHYTQEELTNKGHNFELEESGSTVLCLDYKHNGIGSNSCGPELMEKYRLTDETIDFSIRLIPESK